MRLLCVVGVVGALMPVTVPVRRLAALHSMLDLTPKTDDNEIRLADLIFSQQDPRLEVASNPDWYGPEFCKYVMEKADESDDIEERVALKSLIDMVQTVLKAVEVETERQAAKSAPSIDVVSETETEVLDAPGDVIAAARTILEGDRTEAAEMSNVEPMFMEAGLSGDALKTYEALLGGLVSAAQTGQLTEAVLASFDRCDYSLLELAAVRRESSEEPFLYTAVIEAVNALAAQRLELAVVSLTSVLRAGPPVKMFERIDELAARGELDRQLIELLDANRQQAEQAGAAGADAAKLMTLLANRCRDELDKRIGSEQPEKKLLRALLRCGDDKDARDTLIRRAFEPKVAIELGFDGKKSDEGPDVLPPAFIAACLQLIADFGNMNDNGVPFAARVRGIANQAEAIATEIYGEAATPRDQQDRMWHEATTSVFELEAAEMQAEMEGEAAPWANDNYDNMLPTGWDGTGDGGAVKRIGGG